MVRILKDKQALIFVLSVNMLTFGFSLSSLMASPAARCIAFQTSLKVLYNQGHIEPALFQKVVDANYQRAAAASKTYPTPVYVHQKATRLAWSQAKKITDPKMGRVYATSFSVAADCLENFEKEHSILDDAFAAWEPEVSKIFTENRDEFDDLEDLDK